MEAYNVLFARCEKTSRRAAIARAQEEQEEDIGCASSESSTIGSSSSSSSSGVELADDASSSGSTGHFEMASLMTQLPIKRGLSMFFDGKSQSFASLAAVAGLEDLPKPQPPPSNKRLKTSRSYCAVGFNFKDASRGSLSAAACKRASRARLSAPALGPPARRLMRTRAPVTAAARPAGQPLFFA